MQEQTCPSFPGTIHALVPKYHVLEIPQTYPPVLGKLEWLVTLELKLEFASKNPENEGIKGNVQREKNA